MYVLQKYSVNENIYFPVFCDVCGICQIYFLYFYHASSTYLLLFMNGQKTYKAPYY